MGVAGWVVAVGLGRLIGWVMGVMVPAGWAAAWGVGVAGWGTDAAGWVVVLGRVPAKPVGVLWVRGVVMAAPVSP